MVRGVFTVPQGSMSIAMMKRAVNGAALGTMVPAASIVPRANIATAPAAINAFGAAPPPMALAASTAQPGSTRSEG